MSSNNHTIYRDVQLLALIIQELKARTSVPTAVHPSGVCGFDGFIDAFVRLQKPPSMAEFGPMVTAAVRVAASYPVRHLGDKFGGNGPLFAAMAKLLDDWAASALAERL
jgi:hypothetical protein